MESLYFLIPLSLVVLLAAIGLFVWAVNSGQYDDIEREGERILQDDEMPEGDRQAQSEESNKARDETREGEGG